MIWNRDGITWYSEDEVESYKQSEQEGLEIVAELKAENEQLKALCDTYRTCYRAKHSDIKGMLFKYRATLQEIKAIAENREIFCENCSFCCDEFTCDDCGYVKILQIITKAEEE